MNYFDLERFLVIRIALRRGLIGDALRLWSLPARSTAYRWRKRLSGKAPIAVAPPATSYRGDLAALLGAAQQYRVILPSVADDPATFRAAGSRRLAWPAEGARFADLQDAHAWHRLYWTLELDTAALVARLDRWLGTPLDRDASHPYATSERMHVIAELLGTYGSSLGPHLTERLAAQLRADATWLYDRVETHLGIQNHPLNNARALCAASYLLRDDVEAPRWLARARLVWDTLWPKLILADGVFSEQSSHYHVLLTRTLLEYIRDARMDGRALTAEMEVKARAMCRVTNDLVRPDGSVPLFGDISPDLPTAWLRGLPAVCSAAGLLDTAPRDTTRGYAAGASALGYAETTSLDLPCSPDLARDVWEMHIYKSGGLLFARNFARGIELAAHGDPRSRTECHGDTGRGSFEIWCQGRRIVVDGGMPTYASGELRRQFRGVEGQNVVCVNGLAPALLQDEAADFPAWYLDTTCHGHWTTDESSATFIWRGLGRHLAGLIWRRTWRWSDSTITVDDCLDGWEGVALIEACLHFGSGPWRSTSARTFEMPGCHLRVVLPDRLGMTLTSMTYSTDYGVLLNGQGIRARGRIRLPARWSWTFQLDEMVQSCAE